MRHALPLLLVAGALPAAAAPAAPALRIFADGFPRGAWEASEGGRGAARRMTLADPAALLFAGRVLPRGCRLTVLADTPERAVVSWTCPGGDSGRSEIRRDHAGLYVVHAQGVSGRLPFASSAEYRFLGD